jgi:hypothetical protein
VPVLSHLSDARDDVVALDHFSYKSKYMDIFMFWW